MTLPLKRIKVADDLELPCFDVIYKTPVNDDETEDVSEPRRYFNKLKNEYVDRQSSRASDDRVAALDELLGCVEIVYVGEDDSSLRILPKLSAMQACFIEKTYELGSGNEWNMLMRDFPSIFPPCETTNLAKELKLLKSRLTHKGKKQLFEVRSFDSGNLMWSDEALELIPELLPNLQFLRVEGNPLRFRSYLSTTQTNQISEAALVTCLTSLNRCTRLDLWVVIVPESFPLRIPPHVKEVFFGCNN